METTISRSEHDTLKSLVYQMQVQLAALQAKIRTVTDDYVALASDFTILVDATSAAVTVTLPDPSVVPGQVLNIKKIDSSDNPVTVDGDAVNVDGDPSVDIAVQWENLQVQSNGSAWFII